MLITISNINKYKRSFSEKLNKLKDENPLFNNFLEKIFIEDNGYVVGGFLRDIILNKESRDIDIVFNVDQNKLLTFLKESNLDYKINRMAGIKIFLKEFEADIWTINNNWAFKNRVVKKNDKNLLESIANGCFYNYDSLVINIKSGSINVRNYNNFALTKQLDILQKTEVYKNRNPTLEANILRALYIQKMYDIDFTTNCLSYLAKKLIELNTKFDDPVERLNDIKKKYKKYSNALSDQEIFTSITEICYEYGTSFIKKENKDQTSLFL